MQRANVAGRVRVSRLQEQRIAAGHLWVFAGEIETVEGEPTPGDLVDLTSGSGRFCGRGLFNPHSKIRVRILTFQDEPIHDDFWRTRLLWAASLRKRVVSNTNAYRLVHGEGDLLPGLIVDRYADVLVMQTLSIGMDRRKELLADALTRLTGASAVYLRNDTRSRRLEGLPTDRGFVRGKAETRIGISEGSARFLVDIEHGQKTGWFCDQRENRMAAAALTKGARVLEVFCHTGAFGIQAALRGAASVLGLDSSGEAITWAREHAQMNEVSPRSEYRQADAFEELPKLERAGHRYDAVILDPPAFARSRASVPRALAGYKEINLRALSLLRPEGFLITCSCSYHVSERSFWGAILEAAHDARRQVRLLEVRSQASDHPMLASMPETRYLKCFILQAF
jgi:23S rRNA (cytosine1962-C5)-methyltransferase